MFSRLKKTLFGRSGTTGKYTTSRPVSSEKIQKAIDDTLTRYSKTFRDLANYDRGESFKSR